jgi:hypothetical protein
MLEHQVPVPQEENPQYRQNEERQLHVTARIVDWPARGIRAKD